MNDFKNDFAYSYTDEPHATRRKQILAKYPQIKTLFGPDPMFKYHAFLTVSAQLFMAYWASNLTTNNWHRVIVAYVVGGTLNHRLLSALHECVHNLAFEKFYLNRWFSFFVTLPTGGPCAHTFKRYHMDHHKYQGEDGVDVVIPTALEGKLFQGPIGKFLFVFFQLVFFAVRHAFINPHKKYGRMEAANWIIQLTFDAAIAYYWGLWALGYLWLSTFLGCGLHPGAAHFFAEHYTFDEGAETYSYYGAYNILMFNLGYHNEHHDFPNIPGSRLPLVTKIAPEFYGENVPVHKSYMMVFYKFIMDPKMTPFSRIKRNRLTPKEKLQVQSR